ncbi:MAG: amino acid-binding protein [Dehalococcoidia bacterium]|nr:amino acid-binding protein [Dehalococcoidia bacterium]
MRIKQISVFAENTRGRLLAMLKALDNAQVSLRAISVSENADFGIVRMIMDNPEKGATALREAGFTERTDTMLSIEIPDVPSGMLKTVLQPLSEENINIEYFYAFLEQEQGFARIVLKTSDDEKAEKLLSNFCERTQN